MRILIVEDYGPLRGNLAQALREEGHSVDLSGDGDRGWDLMSSFEYDLVLLDLMLPGTDGLELLRRFRAAGHDSHVLVLTARDSVEERVEGLDQGADDYLIKPFAMEELLARVRALLRRGYGQKSPVLHAGHVEIRTADQRVTVDGEEVELTAREYALLEYLAMRAGQVVSRADVWEHLYDANATASSNVVDVYVGYLRKKLDRPGRPPLIETRRGAGYMLTGRSA